MKQLTSPTYIWQLPNWPHFTWQEKVLLPSLSQTRLKQGKLLARISQLPPDDSLTAQAKLLTQETSQTASLEGISYNPKSIRSSVNRRLGLPYGGLPTPTAHIDGLVKVLLNATQHYREHLTLKRLNSWHASLFPTGYSNLTKIRTGKLRNDKSGPMQVISGHSRREIIHFEAPPAPILPQQLRHFLSWWYKDSLSLDGIIRAGLAHLWFITLHPYDDGNGRLARALTDMALAQDDHLPTRYYSLSHYLCSQRKQYYQILETTQKGQLDITPWLNWFILAFDHALSTSESLIATILTKAKFWRLHQNANLNRRQKKVINHLLDAGPNGFQGGLTNQKYTHLAKTSRATAYREILSLLNQHLLIKTAGKGRNSSYQINWPSPLQ